MEGKRILRADGHAALHVSAKTAALQLKVCPWGLQGFKQLTAAVSDGSWRRSLRHSPFLELQCLSRCPQVRWGEKMGKPLSSGPQRFSLSAKCSYATPTHPKTPDCPSHAPVFLIAQAGVVWGCQLSSARIQHHPAALHFSEQSSYMDGPWQLLAHSPGSFTHLQP